MRISHRGMECVSHHTKMCARMVWNVLYLNTHQHPLLPALSPSRSSGPSAWLLCLTQQCSQFLCVYLSLELNSFAVQQHYSTLLWISVCIIIIFSPRLLPVLLLLHSSGCSLMVLSLYFTCLFGLYYPV
jgi:hypothetical protein